MRNANQRERILEAEPDMTPMIDVVFLLIIFFLCIDFRVLEAKLPAYLPRSAGPGPSLEPQPQLRVAILCTARGTEVPRDPSGESFLLRDHRIQWQVNARTVRDETALRAELDSIHADRSTWIPDEAGRPRPLPVVVSPGRHTTYGDVTRTLDNLSAAGFAEISFSPGPLR